jgi:hypothetical protein
MRLAGRKDMLGEYLGVLLPGCGGSVKKRRPVVAASGLVAPKNGEKQKYKRASSSTSRPINHHFPLLVFDNPSRAYTLYN